MYRVEAFTGEIRLQGTDMYRGVTCTGARRVQGRLCIVERMILKYILRNWRLGILIGSSWLRIGTGGEHL